MVVGLLIVGDCMLLLNDSLSGLRTHCMVNQDSWTSIHFIQIYIIYLFTDNWGWCTVSCHVTTEMNFTILINWKLLFQQAICYLNFRWANILHAWQLILWTDCLKIQNTLQQITYLSKPDLYPFASQAISQECRNDPFASEILLLAFDVDGKMGLL